METDNFMDAQEALLGKLMRWLSLQPEWPVILAMPREARKAAQREVVKMVYRMPTRTQIAEMVAHEQPS